MTHYIGTIENTGDISKPWGSIIEIDGKEKGFYISNHQDLPLSVIEKIKKGNPQAGFFELIDNSNVKYLNPRSSDINYS